MKELNSGETSKSEFLNISGYILHSRANGPGLRCCLWVQGCSMRCPGCFNEGLRDPAGGRKVSVDELFEMLIRNNEGVEGITVSGGEPFDQPHPALARFFRMVKEHDEGLTIVAFTGYSYEKEFIKFEYSNIFREYIDVLVSGRYMDSLRLAKHLQGSSNKVFTFFTSRYSADDFAAVPPGEIKIGKGGFITVSGIDPVRM